MKYKKSKDIKKKKLTLKSKKESEEKYEKKLEKILNFISPDTKYMKFKYKTNLYSVGDNIIIKSNDDYQVARIQRIIPINGILKFRYWPSIEVELYVIFTIIIIYKIIISYFRKFDIDRQNNGLIEEDKFDSISQYEVFKSDIKEIIVAERVISRCKVFIFFNNIYFFYFSK